MNQRAYNFHRYGFILFTLLLWSIAGTRALAQSTATLQGSVVDSSGAAIANATIIVRNPAKGFERTTQTDSSGNYQVAALPVGAYQIEVMAAGFQTQVVNNLPLEVSQTVAQNFQLKVGGVAQEVTVAAGAPVVETTTITVGQVINQKTVQEIPLNGRHFVDLGLLIPGSVTPPQNGFLTAPLRGQGSFAFVTAGNREDTVNFMVNGINLNDMSQNQITFQPSINTVQEFKVDNSTFSAEYGRNSGAIANIATRSGTNEFHGEVFEFLRNNKLDARNFFDFYDRHPERPPDPNNPKKLTNAPFKRNQFGAALGGPIIKDKTFFFFSYEGLRQRQGLTINSGVLLDDERARVTDPTVRRLLDFIPRATALGVAPGGTIFGRFFGAATAPVNIDQWTGDVSHVLTKDDRLHGYYAIQRDVRGEPTLQGNTIPGFGDTRQSRRQIFTLNETHTFSPTLVNEARFGFNRIHITFNPNTKLNPADFGINNGINAPLALPQITVGGIELNFGGPAGFPQGRGDTTFVLSDTASYLLGRHSLRIGGEFRRFYNNNFANEPGRFNFASTAAFLAGTATQFNVTLGKISSSVGTGALGFFVQDSFKWLPNLTLEFGLRYDWFMTPSERFNRFVIFDPATVSLVRVGSGIDQIYPTSNKNIQPRVGFAWDPFKDGKTSIRAAYAILADQPVTNLLNGPVSNPPLATPVTFTGPVRFDNAITVAGPSGIAPVTVDRHFTNAYVQSWNLNIQREITPGLGLMVGYFASKGTNLRIARNINQLVNGVRPYRTLSASSPILPGTSVSSNIVEIGSGGNSNYNALWVTANKRFSGGLQFNASYTWSKSIDYNSLNSPPAPGVTVQDSYNIRGDRGPSDFDARHRFVLSGLYELPLRGNRLMEGWQVSTIVQLQSGNPINIVAGNLLEFRPASQNATVLNGININAFTGLATVRPDVIGAVSLNRSYKQWFTNTVCDPRDPRVCPAGSVFALPYTPGQGFHFGNLGRNAFVGPRFINTDFSVIKNTKITEVQMVQFRVEFFDLFNHANFGQPGRVAQRNSADFGAIRTTRFPTGDSGSSRQIQFALKYIF